MNNCHHWMIYNLDTSELLGCPKLEPVQKGIHTLIVHGHYLDGCLRQTVDYAVAEIAQKLLLTNPKKQSAKISSLKKDATKVEDILASASVIACDIDLTDDTNRDTIISFFAQLRDVYTQNHSRFQQEALILILPFWAWDILHDRRLLSVVDYREYLCWNGAGLLEVTQHTTGQDLNFFRGAGFHTRTEQQRFLSLDKYSPGELNRDCRTALLWLQKQEQGLVSLEKSGQVILDPAESDMNYMYVLTSFLPPYRLSDETNKVWIPSNLNNWGGPQEWKSIWELDMHTRHLLMDGWLSLWPDVDTPGKLWLQPASLSLLYWAARHTGQPHTETPKAFLDNYQWDGARWFGGRWKKSRDQTGEHKVPNEKTPQIPSNGVNDKFVIKLFISYARRDNKDDEKVSKFINELQVHFNASTKYHYQWWADWKILIGQGWEHEIKKALEECHFGLLLVSLPFLTSEYIGQRELPILLQDKRALPIGFQHFDLNGEYELKGLQETQIFRFKDKFYDRCSPNGKKDFLADLYKQIQQRIDGMLSNH